MRSSVILLLFFLALAQHSFGLLWFTNQIYSGDTCDSNVTLATYTLCGTCLPLADTSLQEWQRIDCAPTNATQMICQDPACTHCKQMGSTMEYGCSNDTGVATSIGEEFTLPDFDISQVVIEVFDDECEISLDIAYPASDTCVYLTGTSGGMFLTGSCHAGIPFVQMCDAGCKSGCSRITPLTCQDSNIRVSCGRIY